MALKKGFTVVVLDFDGEYELPKLPLLMPIEAIPDVVAQVVASESRTSGAATYVALKRALRRGGYEFEELLHELEKGMLDPSIRWGAQAAWARLQPLMGICKLCRLDEFQRYISTGRIDLSRIRFLWSRITAAAVILSAFSLLTPRAPLLLVLEEAHYYFEPGNGYDLERRGLRRNVKIVRVQQQLSSFLNYIPVIGYGGAEWHKKVVNDLGLPEEMRNLKKFDFIYYSPKRRRWRKFRVTPRGAGVTARAGEC